MYVILKASAIRILNVNVSFPFTEFVLKFTGECVIGGIK